MRLFAACSLFLALICVAYPAAAKEIYGIAMNGEPAYQAGFSHLSYVNPDAPKGGTLKLAKTGTFNTLNNHIINGTAAEGLEYLNDKLMQRVWDEPFSLYGLVAEKADIAEDRSSVTFHLNPKARFHDGKPMTSEDVKFSFESYKKNGHPVRRRVYGLVDTVKIIDPQTIYFHFGEGYDRESVMILAMMPVLPKHYWEKTDITKTTLTAPLGSGPYKIKNIDPGRKITYERVTDYWAKDLPINRGLYNFDQISYSYFRDDDIALQAFKANDYDLRREYDITKWKTGYDGNMKNTTMEAIPHGRPEGLKSFVFNTRKAKFADRRVREAISLMFNGAWINKNFFYGELHRINSLYPNSELATQDVLSADEQAALEPFKETLPAEAMEKPYRAPETSGRDEQKKAMALLKDAGWIYRNQKLLDAAGNPFTFEILLDSTNDEKIALFFARSLQKIGITATVRTVDSSQFVGRLESFDFDMVTFRWINSLSPGNEQLNYWGSAAAEMNGSRNYAGIRNKAVDTIADSIARSGTRAELVGRTRALDRIISWDYDLIPWFYLGRDLTAYRDKLQRPQTVPVYGIVLESWWQKTAQTQ